MILSSATVYFHFFELHTNWLVFTPLFLGASLFVPTADDIGTPGRLAEWMDKVKATVTHLTPGIFTLQRV
jgi:non-ribosomal peptide synthetase component F